MRLLSFSALLALTGCGAGEDPGGEEPAGGPGPGGDETVYRGALTVIETPEHGPQLAGVIAESFPPQGGGLDIANWDWDAVEHQSEAGTRWGDYLVTGTFDGEAFALTEEPVPTGELDPSEFPELQYTEPEIEEPAERLAAEELNAAVQDLADRYPAIVNGGWVDTEHAVAVLDVTLVTPELSEQVERDYPEGAVVFAPMLKPVS